MVNYSVSAEEEYMFLHLFTADVCDTLTPPGGFYRKLQQNTSDVYWLLSVFLNDEEITETHCGTCSCFSGSADRCFLSHLQQVYRTDPDLSLTQRHVLWTDSLTTKSHPWTVLLSVSLTLPEMLQLHLWNFNTLNLPAGGFISPGSVFTFKTKTLF